MNPTTHEVLAALRWTRVQILSDAGISPARGPRPPDCPLGRLFSRQDEVTARSLAEEMLHSRAIDVDAEVREMRNRDMGETTNRRSRSRAEQLVVAERFQLAVRRTLDPRDLDLVDRVIVSKSFKELEQYFPGRVWFSLRDDFDKISERISASCGDNLAEIRAFKARR